ncbi:MAG: hypothetical protein E3J78_06500 [Candidatus Cloacimonadota bacterium]|nr:MAG: hypothetical protein E3J78_06500 [Candidatus Cloacimonadota bacterium]
MISNLRSKFLIVILLLSIPALAFPHTLRIFGKNHLSYWQWQDSTGINEHFLRDILTVNATYGNFRGNVEWYVYEPSDVTFRLRSEGLRKRFIEYKKPEWSIRAGNFYSSLGRGLILNQTDETAGSIERNMDGLIFRYTYKFASLTLLSGRPKNIHFINKQYFIVNATSDLLQAGNIVFNPVSFFLPFSINFVRLSSDDPASSLSLPFETLLYSFGIEPSIGPFIAYVEIARKEGWDGLLFAEAEGMGIYGSLTFFLEKFSASFEYLQYDSLGYGGSIYRYNAPPTANLDNYSINRGSDEKGWMIDVTSNPFGDMYVQINKSTLSTISSDSIGFEEFFGEIKSPLWHNGPSMLASGKQIIYRWPEPIVEQKTELIPHIELLSAMRSHSLKLGLGSRIVEIDSIGKAIDFRDDAISVDIGIFSYLSLSGRWERRNREVLFESEGTEWKVFEIRWDLSNAHTLHIMVGSEKGGLVCTGGICRIEEPFEGIKVNLFSRF